jgi:mRNA-degrading endonuclease RelE of RelBE toxin-antitoxin system
MKVRFTERAISDLEDLPKADARRIEEAAQQVADTHPQRMAFVTELTGVPGYWRLRQGKWRAIYRFEGDELIVESVGKRADIYR